MPKPHMGKMKKTAEDANKSVLMPAAPFVMQPMRRDPNFDPGELDLWCIIAKWGGFEARILGAAILGPDA